MNRIASEAHGRIYVATNLVNGKQYVGQTTQLVVKRWRQHRNGRCVVLVNAIKKYGLENFEVVEIDQAFAQNELDVKEKFWIVKLGTLVPHGYNLKAGGDGGGRASDQARLHMRLAQLGKKQSPECVEKRIASLRGRQRPSHVVAGMIERRRARGPISEATRQRMIVSHTGKKLPEDQRARMREAQRARREQEKETGGGPTFTSETRRKMREAKLGTKHSDETRVKMRASHQRRLYGEGK